MKGGPVHRFVDMTLSGSALDGFTWPSTRSVSHAGGVQLSSITFAHTKATMSCSGTNSTGSPFAKRAMTRRQREKMGDGVKG